MLAVVVDVRQVERLGLCFFYLLSHPAQPSLNPCAVPPPWPKFVLKIQLAQILLLVWGLFLTNPSLFRYMCSHIEAAISLINVAHLLPYIQEGEVKCILWTFVLCGILSLVIIYTCEQRHKNKSRQIILKTRKNPKARDQTQLKERLISLMDCETKQEQSNHSRQLF
jgi:hypothetical protein